MCGLKGDVRDFFGFEKWVIELLCQAPDFATVLERIHLGLNVTALEGDDAVGKRILLLVLHILPYEFDEVRHRHDCTADDEVIFAFFLYGVFVFADTIFEPYGFSDGCRDLHFLADGVNEFEMHLGKENGERYPRETTPGAEIKHLCAGTESDDAGNAEAVEHVVGIEIVDVLAAYHIDLGIPFAVKCIEGVKLALLFVSELWKVFQNKFVVHCSATEVFGFAGLRRRGFLSFAPFAILDLLAL